VSAHRVRTLLTGLLLAAAVPSGSAAAQRAGRAWIVSGNVVYRPGTGAARALTRTGLDTMAVLSPDGALVAFVRRTPGTLVPTTTGPDEATELWAVRVDGTGARRLVRGRDDRDPRRALAALASPQFSPDGRRLYFTSTAWVTSDAVHVVDLATGRERFVAPANDLEVLRRGPDAGRLLVEQHHAAAAPHAESRDEYWLLDADGRPLRRLGDTEAADTEARLAEVRASGR
jgi:dipeptidyl aminopeptidase/acylaminoacyl peptidase